MKIGVRLTDMKNITAQIEKAASLGIHSCQLCSWDLNLHTEELAQEILAALEKYDMTISTFWAGWSGPAVWDFIQGPTTLGLLPTAFRYRRVQDLKAGADFAKRLGIAQVATHAGFIPENPHDPMYADMIAALREVALHLKANDQYLLFETGQETPVTLLRAMEDIGTGNLGVNLDTGNLILYGKGNPVDSLEIIGKYVMDLHIKDGVYPTDGWHLGKEVAVGDGKVDFPGLIAGLKQLGYDGALTIEREITGDEQIADILRAKEMLENLM